MLTIILGIAISLFVTVLLMLLSDELIPIASSIGFLGILFSLILGIFFPISGYNEWELEKSIPLVSLTNSVQSTSSSGIIYVSRSIDNVYSYRYEVENIDPELTTPSSTNYETDTVSGNVIEQEDPYCEVPELKIYKRTAKRSIWTFAIWDETKYIFHVPEGTITKDIILK